MRKKAHGDTNLTQPAFWEKLFPNISCDSSYVSRVLNGNSIILNYSGKQIPIKDLINDNDGNPKTYALDRAEYLMRLFCYNSDVLQDNFLMTELTYYADIQNYAVEFYSLAFDYVLSRMGSENVFLRIDMPNDYKLPEQVSHLKKRNGASVEGLSYNRFIDLICNVMPNLTKYQAVTLTIPDSQSAWTDHSIDINEHILKPFESQINSSDNVLEKLREISRNPLVSEKLSRALSIVLDEDLLRKTVARIYSYGYHICLKNTFARITSLQGAELYEKLLDFMEKLCKALRSEEYPQIEKLSEFLYCQTKAEMLSPEKTATGIDMLCICLYKLVCFVLLYELTGKAALKQLIPLATGDDYIQFFSKNINYIENISSIKDKIKLYSLIAGNLSDKSEEFINRLCNDILSKTGFLRLINNTNVQKLLKSELSCYYEDIKMLYKIVYNHVKYRLYRSYYDINENAGIMRNSFNDRELVLDFIKNGYAPICFKFEKSDGKVADFVLRLANEDDIESIMKLNNPNVPFRRAVYVKSEFNEIVSAVKANEVFIIEELKNDSVINLACVCIILRCFYGMRRNSYSTDSMNFEYENEYFAEVGRAFGYLDYDSVLVNDGRAGLNLTSYRGCGFQRLTLVLAEEIAIAEERDYICATVSPINRPSKRNFMLNGYKSVAKKVYTLSSDKDSEFIKYLNNASECERAEYQKKVKSESEYLRDDFFDILNLNEEDYKSDNIVPRDYVVLQLKQS